MALLFGALAGCSFPEYSFSPEQGGSGGSGGLGAGGGAAGAGQAGAGQAGQGGGAGGSGAGGGSAGGGPGVVVASGQRNVGRMVADKSNLFWVVPGTEAEDFLDGKVLSCPSAGCLENGPTVLAVEQHKPEFIDFADDNYGRLLGEIEEGKYIYWTNSGSGKVMRCLKTGCGAGGPTVLASEQQGPAGVRASASLPFVGDEGGGEPVVFWANAESGQVLSCPADGCGGTAPSVIAEGLDRPRHLVSGNKFIYFLEEADGGRLYKQEKGVGGPVAQSPTLASPTRLTLASSVLFAVDRGSAASGYADGKIVWANPNDDSQSVFVDNQKNLFSIVADDNEGNVYWVADGALLYCALGPTCAGGPKQLAAGVDDAEIAYDGLYVYFVVGDTIRKVPKP